MNRFPRMILTLLAGFAFAPAAQSQTLDVENVRFTQNADAKVVVQYDLLGKASEEYTVILSVFIPESRKKIPLSTRSLTGDVGQAVRPGRGLEIEWDLKRDFPNGLEGDGFRFIIDAYVMQKKASKWPWIAAGVAAIGGTALLLSGASSSGAGNNADLPAPPTLPTNQ